MSGNTDSSSMTSSEVHVGPWHIHLNACGEGHPVLMLHGGGPGASGLSNYSKNIAALARNFRVLVPDLPGYGQSSKSLDHKDPFGSLAGAMLGLMDTLGIASAHIIGNSLGGAAALRMALDAPSRVSALVLMGPGGINTTRSMPTKGLKQLLNYYEGEGPQLQKLRAFIAESLVYDSSQVPEELIMERYEASLDPEVIAAPPLRRPRGIPNFRALDFTRDPRLADCQTPTLVLWGLEDRVNRPSGAYSLQQRMDNCDIHMFSKTGHWVQWERAEEFNAVVNSFLATRS